MEVSSCVGDDPAGRWGIWRVAETREAPAWTTRHLLQDDLEYLPNKHAGSEQVPWRGALPQSISTHGENQTPFATMLGV